jgi:hypothetical protein
LAGEQSEMSSPDRVAVLEKAYTDLVSERNRLRDARASFTGRLGPLPASAAIAIVDPRSTGRSPLARFAQEMA